VEQNGHGRQTGVSPAVSQMVSVAGTKVAKKAKESRTMNDTDLKYFAGQALNGILAAENENCAFGNRYLDEEGNESVHSTGVVSGAIVKRKIMTTRHQLIADEAVECARALIAKLEKP